MTQLKKQLLDSMTFRCIGPPRGGRVVAVAGDPVNSAVFYFGAVAGGIWKTEDAGTTWRNVSDGFLRSSSVGALTVSESDPNVIFAGMGETTIRTDVVHGDGVYRSNDGGQTWTHLGLAETRYIAEIRIAPKNPGIVYVAALGHAFGPNQERGVYRTRDGGQNWERVLFKSENAGAVDITLDPRNPEILYASFWQAHRNFWELSSGGPESGIWKSVDGGDTWVDITRNKGLPQTGILGKVGLSASPAKAGRVWALIESDTRPGLFRSDDFGERWTLVSDKQDLRYRPWYYMHVFADPVDAETVYVNNLDMWKSTDGGATFIQIPTPHGDNHDLWIDPRDNRRMVQGNDGGANVSFNGGASWSTIHNQLTAQFYTVDTDNQFPYRVYGTQQDNSSISVPSDTISGGIAWSDCYPAGTGESGYIAVHPENPDIVYVGAVGSSPGGAGALQRYDHRTGQIQLVNVWPQDNHGYGAKNLKYRFPWTYPILFSPHDAGVLYTCGNHVFRSLDEGHSWEPISPDLTRGDESKLGPSGGPITKDTSGAENYATLYTFRESALQPGLFWAGSDDGLVHLSRDGGETWHDVTPPDLPEWSFIRTLEPSPHSASTVYLAATRYKLDDPAPYLYRSTDYGRSWQSIIKGIPEDDFVRVIRADPKHAGLLYAGSETGLYVSFDDGGEWHRWEANLPITPVYDLKVKADDLVVATHGRAFWIVDDLTPLHHYEEELSSAGAALFAPRTTYRILPDLFAGWSADEGKGYALGLGTAVTYVAERDENGRLTHTFLDAGQGAPRGVAINYLLADEATRDESLSLAILDADGVLLREFKPKPKEYESWDEQKKEMQAGPWMPVAAGPNRFFWDLRLEGSTRVPGDKTTKTCFRGPLVLPGHYQVRLATEGGNLVEEFEVVNDPRSKATQEELAEQLTLLQAIYAKLSETHEAVIRLRRVRQQISDWQERLAGHEEILAAAANVVDALDAIEDVLILPGEQKDTFGLNERVRLNAALASVISVVNSADARPTVQARALAEEYFAQIDGHLDALASTLDGDVAALNGKIQAAGVPAIGVS